MFTTLSQIHTKKGARAEDIVKDVWNECKMHRDVVEAEIGNIQLYKKYLNIFY
jgi:hypothetical protein